MQDFGPDDSIDLPEEVAAAMLEFRVAVEGLFVLEDGSFTFDATDRYMPRSDDGHLASVLHGFEVSSLDPGVVSQAVRAEESMIAELGLVGEVAPTAALASAADAISASLPPCPFGSKPSPIGWHFVPTKNYFDLRCRHEPPEVHCFHVVESTLRPKECDG